jgi:hypothetical protein
MMVSITHIVKYSIKNKKWFPLLIIDDDSFSLFIRERNFVGTKEDVLSHVQSVRTLQ